MADKVLYSKDGRVVRITINRPEVRNAIDPDTSLQLRETFGAFAADDDAWIAILSGADGTFSAGADLKALSAAGGKFDLEVPFAGITKDFFCPKPILAAIEGPCLAGGLELALCCDLRVAGASARIGLPETRWGLLPAAGGTQRLPRAIGASRALQLIMLAEPIDANEAKQMGIVQSVADDGTALETAMGWAETLLERGPLAVRAAKKAVLGGLDGTLEQGFKLEAELAAENRETDDYLEGPRAFAEKRKPDFKAR